jgi:hypothetical protein
MGERQGDTLADPEVLQSSLECSSTGKDHPAREKPPGALGALEMVPRTCARARFIPPCLRKGVAAERINTGQR